MVVVLPAPLPPSRPTVQPLGHDEAYVIDRPLGAVFLAEKIRLDGGRYLDLADVERRQSLGRDRRRIDVGTEPHNAVHRIAPLTRPS